MASASHSRNHIFKKERLKNLFNAASVLFYTVFFTVLFSFYLLYHPRSTVNYTTNINQEYNQTTVFTQPYKNDSRSCNLFKGQWILDERGSMYTNFSCKTIPYKRNCFLNGREDRDFLHWRWKPDQCELPRFSPETFLSTLRGKTMAFIGDSIGRNQMESLLCLLSTVETPKEVYKDAEDLFRTWEFSKHNFTLMAFWSQFLVTATERVFNGSATGGFDLQLDKVDQNWSKKLPLMDYVIFSDAHWFFRQNYLYESNNLIGCVYCQAPNVTDLGPSFAIKSAFQAAFKEINMCKNCKKIFAFLRTFSPSHFENGTWNTGGGCNRTRPIVREEVVGRDSDWEFKNIQVEEIEIARKIGEYKGNRFEILDITEIMVIRPDGHPGLYWGNPWMKGYSDCIHWCLPGPIDTWNELLLEMIKR
ncbi:ALTERED XYLOGLUCAN 4-like [Olea europaea subsp. europaea]|uniref:ALTERED XYLOGLUCAN 4-like n=1 Tax=Olea europaea subsp. europaea TaxID=158383 RepID=A0A8S0TWL3_OLEEU|nr:ALTERED XYLOGLUCAN 4-like [Olea europaea subsp. europaea]